MIACVQTMHKYGFVHRDIKCENFIVSKDNTDVHIIDFGLSDKSQSAIEENAVVGTPAYCDPCVEEDGWMSDESDVYSLGIVLLKVWLGSMGIRFDQYNSTDNNKKTILLTKRTYATGHTVAKNRTRSR